MSAVSQTFSLPWVEVPEVERRFRRVLLIVVGVFAVLSLIMPWLPLPKVEKARVVELPPRVAELILQRRQQPPPPPPKVAKPEPKKEPEKPKPQEKKPQPAKPKPEPKKPQPKPEPKKQTTEQAREKAASSGVLAFADQLADLRDLSSVSKVTKSERKLTQTTTQNSAAAKKRTTTRSVVTASRDTASAGSGGISSSSVSSNAGGGTQLQARATSKVTAPTSTQAAASRNNSAAVRSASRSEEEISDIIDKNKGALFRIYNRALRKNPTLKGKLVLEITISPAGKVASVRVLSSELGDAALERKLVARIKLINFGAKEVGAVTTTLPIDFFPA